MKNFNLNVKKNLALRGVSLVLAGSLLTCTLSGCSKKVDCDIDRRHAHAYVNDEGFTKYLEKENESSFSYDRTDEYIELSDEEADILKFANKKDLLRIEDNEELICNIESENEDYIEYRYSYLYMMPIPHTVSNGKTSSTYFTYIPMTGYSWTTDKNHSRLTGQQRRCHYVYQAYKIAKNEKGKYVLIPSEYVDSIEELNGEYPYMKENFYKVIDAEYGNDLDYEDGPEEDHEPVEEQEQSYKTQSSTKEKGKTLTKSSN